ncbi:MAG: sensor histidine kinase, partial [Bacteroidia bacterium]
GKIKVEFTDVRNSIYRYRLMVSDNGVGFEKKIKLSDPSTLGLQLINSLADQLGGRLEVDQSKGAAFSICFS